MYDKVSVLKKYKGPAFKTLKTQASSIKTSTSKYDYRLMAKKKRKKKKK